MRILADYVIPAVAVAVAVAVTVLVLSAME